MIFKMADRLSEERLQCIWWTEDGKSSRVTVWDHIEVVRKDWHPKKEMQIDRKRKGGRFEMDKEVGPMYAHCWLKDII